MLVTIIGTIFLGSMHGALQHNGDLNTATGEQPCEVQTAVMSKLDPGKVLYYTCQ